MRIFLKNRSRYLKWAVLWVPLFALLQICLSGSSIITGNEVGKKAPDFTLDGLEGKSYTLSALEGKSVIHIIFTAVWCDPCEGELAKLSDVYDRLHAEGYTVIAIGVPTRQSIERLKEYAEKENIRFPVLYDASGKVVELYNAEFLPRSIIIDRKGLIRYEWNFIPRDYEATVLKLMKE